MIAFLVSITLVAPIPKGDGILEGQIACLVSGKSPRVLVLKSDGSEVMSISLEGIEGHCRAVRQARGGQFALVDTRDEKGDGKIYRLDLRKDATPKLIQNLKASQWIWSITGDGKSAVYSEAEGQNQNTQYTHFIYELATGRRTEIKIGTNFQIVDFAQATNDLVLCHKYTEGNYRMGTAICSIATGKVIFETKTRLYAQAISQDAKSILNIAYPQQNGRIYSQLEFFQVANEISTPIAFPESGVVNQDCHTVSADAKSVAYASWDKNARISKLYIANLERKSAKLVYTAPNGTRIADCDWR